MTDDYEVEKDSESFTSEEAESLFQRAIKVLDEDENPHWFGRRILKDAVERDDVFLLNSCVALLDQGFTNLSTIATLIEILRSEEIADPDSYITVDIMKLYGKVSSTLLQENGGSQATHEIDNVMAGVLKSGEHNEALVESICRRNPKDGEQFIEMLAQAKSVPLNVSSGVL